MFRHPLAVTLMLLGVALLADAVIATTRSNLSTGIWITYILGVLTLAGGLLFPHLPKSILIVGGAGLLALALCVTTVFLIGRHDTVTNTEDVLIVLGASVKGDKPTASLQNRLDRAVAYHRDNPEAIIIVSGGKGDDESVSEAEAMARELTAHGVPPSHIVLEDAATSTAENFAYSLPLIGKEDAAVAFVTNDYHIFRSARNAAQCGLAATHAHAPTPWYMVIPSGLRECVAIVKFLITHQ